MSARRIQRQRNADPRMTRIQVHRQDAVTKKKEERAIKEQYRRERKIESYLADDENFPSFSTQLGKLGLQLRDIPGDGNCLFRALGDQMEGHGRNHFKYRFDVVKYMMEHRDDFEPFVEDDIPFERHILNLKKLGTYAGNDAIVAFARLNQANVVIHQLSAPFLLIQGTQMVIPSTRQIHIAYHNGDHYSSVRKLNDNTESPANIRIQVGSENKTHGKGEYKDGYKYMGLTNGHVAEGIVSAVRDQHIIEEEVMMATNCTDIVQIREALLDCDYDVELTIPHMLQIMELSAIEDTTSLASQQTSTDSGMWSDTGNGFRYASVALTNGQHKPGTHIREDSYGGSSGYGSVSSQNGGARPKLPMQQEKPMSAKQRRETKKIEKKKRAEERNKLKFQTKNQPPVPVNDDASAVTVVSKEIGMMKI